MVNPKGTGSQSSYHSIPRLHGRCSQHRAAVGQFNWLFGSGSNVADALDGFARCES